MIICDWHDLAVWGNVRRDRLTGRQAGRQVGRGRVGRGSAERRSRGNARMQLLELSIINY